MKCLPVLLLNPSAFNARATERSESPALRSLRAAVSTFLARSDGARADILRRVTHKPPPEVFEGYTTFEWEVVCREVVKLDVVGTGAPRCLATVLATVPSQLPVFAMKRAMALPGLEPQSTRANEALLSHSSSKPPKDSGTFEDPTAAPAAHCAGLPAVQCSNVANAVRGLLEHAKQQGIEMDHPSVRAAIGALVELDTWAVGLTSPD